MADIKLNDDNTVILEKNTAGYYDLTINSGKEAIKQDLMLALQTILGEWFLDVTSGLDYFVAMNKGAERYLDSEFNRIISDRPGVYFLKNYERAKTTAEGLSVISGVIVTSEGEFPINLVI